MTIIQIDAVRHAANLFKRDGKAQSVRTWAPTSTSLDELWRAAIGINPIERPFLLSFWHQKKR